MVTPCRVSPPQSIHMITRRTVQRQLWLRPDREVTQCVYYVLGYLKQRYDIEYHTVSVLSNHLHLLLTDLRGDQIQPFNRDLFSLLGRSINCLRGRNENLWNNKKPSCVCVAPRGEDVIDKAAYIVVNPVEAGLVSHAKKWPGVRVLASELGRRRLRVRRPGFFFSEEGCMPEEVAVEFTLPRVWDVSPEQLRKSVIEECQRREESIRSRLQNAGETFMGVKSVLRASTHESAKTREEWFRLSPHVACKNADLRRKFLKWRKRRQKKYDEQRAALLSGRRDVEFPEGTYVLHFYVGQKREDWVG